MEGSLALKILGFFRGIKKRVIKEEPVKIVYWKLLVAFDTVSYKRLLKKTKIYSTELRFHSKQLERAIFLENGKATENQLEGERIDLTYGKSYTLNF